MCLYYKHGGQRGYRGHKDVQSFLDQLPPNVSQLPVLVVRRVSDDNTHIYFRAQLTIEDLRDMVG